MMDIFEERAMKLEEFQELSAERDRLEDLVSKIDDQIFKIALAYRTDFSERVPCSSYAGVGEIDLFYPNGVRFHHNCFDHGHDLHTTESWFLPIGYITDPEAFRRGVQAERDQWKADEAANERARDLRELRRLQKKLGVKEGSTS